MSLITSAEFFINMKSVPRKGDSEYGDLVKYELDKIEYGVTINSVYVSGWLYWHLNHWQSYRPILDKRSGDVKDEFLSPQLRDNEWLISEYFYQAGQEKKVLLLLVVVVLPRHQ